VKPLARFSLAGDTRARGRAGEEAACRWLRKSGFEIITTNYRTKPGEIDIIARDGEDLCFIEVKARASAGHGFALEAVPVAKQRRIIQAARVFLVDSGWDGPCRFDVLGLDRAAGEWEFSLVRDAFWVRESG
jgi:putative endonuclease